ncbi:MAG TPA: zf-HC2 domain-containing protein [Nocardioides sp.]|uniref:anti-sigma factor family protein n=1 Tax=Nocardioides sp. TaxID=35761 RepID=UPI002E351851|nr:zf-HC2 domain-containing protein [Nocardioides sp.]HEX5087792.1 zf-HC2 domain-containing protein [Nocardioides sp.]
MTTCSHEHEDGAYVLGALSPEDRVAFERHLPGCPECARSVRELAGIPGLLARVPAEILDPEQEPLPVPETLLPSLVREVRRTQRRRTWLTSSLVAAAALIAIGAVGATTLGGDEGPPSAAPSAGPTTAAAVQLHQVGTDAISGWLSLTQVGWGTRLDLTCTYGEDNDWQDPRWSTYTMYVQTTDGEVERVASWKVVPGKELHISAATAADTEDISDVQVRTASGATVLELS